MSLNGNLLDITPTIFLDACQVWNPVKQFDESVQHIYIYVELKWYTEIQYAHKKHLCEHM